MKAKIYRVLIIGAGNIGAFYDTPSSKHVLTHAHAFSRNGFKLVGFVDVDYAKASQAAKIWNAKPYHTIHEAYKDNKIDVIIVAVSDDAHYEILKSILDYKVELVLCEKPFTTDIKDAREIIQLYRYKNVQLAINYTRRYLPAFQRLKKQIYQRKYGEYIKGSGYYGKGLLHNGSHIIDLVRYLIGDIASVVTYERVIDYSKSDPNVSAHLRFKKGGQFSLENISSKKYTLFEVDLLFEKGRIRIDDVDYFMQFYQIKRHSLFQKFFVLKNTQTIKTEQQKAATYVAHAIYKSLTQKKSYLCSPKDALKNMEICQKLLTYQK